MLGRFHHLPGFPRSQTLERHFELDRDGSDCQPLCMDSRLRFRFRFALCSQKLAPSSHRCIRHSLQRKRRPHWDPNNAKLIYFGYCMIKESLIVCSFLKDPEVAKDFSWWPKSYKRCGSFLRGLLGSPPSRRFLAVLSKDLPTCRTTKISVLDKKPWTTTFVVFS